MVGNCATRCTTRILALKFSIALTPSSRRQHLPRIKLLAANSTDHDGRGVTSLVARYQELFVGFPFRQSALPRRLLERRFAVDSLRFHDFFHPMR